MEKTFVDFYLLDDFETLIALYNTLESKLPLLNATALAKAFNISSYLCLNPMMTNNLCL
jgi:hypothetical protein